MCARKAFPPARTEQTLPLWITSAANLPAYIPAMGVHNVYDALSAWTLAVSLGLDAKKAAAALAGYKTTGHRQNIVQFRGLTMIEDCYNASPDSMRAALHTLAAYPVRGAHCSAWGYV